MKNQITHLNYTHLRISFKIISISLFIYFNILTHLQAQGNLVAGYIITNQNDTIRGLIKDEEWARSPETVEFKEANKPLQEFSPNNLIGFWIAPTNGIYKSKKIGLLEITPGQVYITAPSLETKDSVHVFLQELVTGRAKLYEYLNLSEQPHFFIEKDNVLKELYNYPFQKSYNSKTYLVVYDEYKKQLTKLCADATDFRAHMPPYQKKYLKQYIEKYNSLFSRDQKINYSKNGGLTFDVDANIGLENWNQPPVVMNNKLTYGFGLRINFPRRFRNRFLKVGLFVTPNVLPGIQYSAYEKMSLNTFEIAVGSYFGSRKLRPYFGFMYSGVYQGPRPDFVGFQAGISYNRRINLEIGHFANFNLAISKSKLLTPARISLHYMLNLNSERSKAR